MLRGSKVPGEIRFAVLFLMALAMVVPSYSVTAQSTCGDRYQVQRGDILVEIAGRCETSVQGILFANPELVDPDLIYPGQELTTPQSPAVAPAGEFTYIALEGDTIDNLALLFGVPEDLILSLNDQLEAGEALVVGQEIRIPAVSAPPETGEDLYRVQPGETLFGIAQQFETSVEAIVEQNPDLQNASLIHVGQLLELPDSGAVPTTGALTYTVRPGDTMSEIAIRFETSIESILSNNPEIEDPRVIFPGETLVFPASDTIEAPSDGEAYAVSRGDSLAQIAEAFGTSVDALLDANPHIRDSFVILPGVILEIPA